MFTTRSTRVDALSNIYMPGWCTGYGPMGSPLPKRRKEPTAFKWPFWAKTKLQRAQTGTTSMCPLKVPTKMANSLTSSGFLPPFWKPLCATMMLRIFCTFRTRFAHVSQGFARFRARFARFAHVSRTFRACFAYVSHGFSHV